MTQLTITSTPQGDTFVIFDALTGVSEEVTLPSIMAGEVGPSVALQASTTAVPEGVDISSRYLYYVN